MRVRGDPAGPRAMDHRYNPKMAVGVGLSLVAHLLWEQRVGGSNPSATTIKINSLRRFLICLNPTNPHTCIFEKFRMGSELAVHHSLPVNVHGRSHICMSHHLLLNTYCGSHCIEPAAKGVPERRLEEHTSEL